MTVLWVILAVVVVVLGYIRLAPSDPDQWHVIPPRDTNADFRSGVVRVVQTGPDGLERLDAVARATPRTEVLAGSLAAGMITYVTRSAVFGFPDYTTVRMDGDRMIVWARQRFGRSDLGVNRARVEQWLQAVEPR